MKICPICNGKGKHPVSIKFRVKYRGRMTKKCLGCRGFRYISRGRNDSLIRNLVSAARHF